ncbi:MAG: sensor histidine kinase [Actinobacteria bacterium]|nr:sensor histidine kinase [Actinomycetota bacterium]
MTTSLVATSRQDAFRHDALLYDGEDEFVSRVSALIDDAVAADEPIRVVASAEKIARLRPAADRSPLVELADMAEVGGNPAWIIPQWAEFLSRHAGRAVRGVGEPVTAERDNTELVEYQHLESLLNLAFADATGFWLVCPYDTGALTPAVLAEAHRSHPCIATGSERRRSGTYRGLDAVAVRDDPLPEPDACVAAHGLRPGRLAELRAFVADQGQAAGLDDDRAADLVVAANEVASNSLMYGAGHARVRMWREGTVICEIADAGVLVDPLAGRRAPGYEEHDRRGMWMVNQLCDLVQVRSLPAGTVVRLHMRVD